MLIFYSPGKRRSLCWQKMAESWVEILGSNCACKGDNGEARSLIIVPFDIARFPPSARSLRRRRKLLRSMRGMEEAASYFGWFARFAAMDNPTSSRRTRELLGWEPVQPGLIADLDGNTISRRMGRLCSNSVAFDLSN